MAKASDCGSEDRGFESHYPPHKLRGTPTGCLLIYGMDAGLERPAPVRTLVQKQSGGLFLGRGRVHGFQNAVRRDCGLKTITGFQGHPNGVPLNLWNGYRTRKAGTSAHTGAKTVRWTVFRPWESPWFSERSPQGLWAENHNRFPEAPQRGAS